MIIVQWYQLSTCLHLSSFTLQGQWKPFLPGNKTLGTSIVYNYYCVHTVMPAEKARQKTTEEKSTFLLWKFDVITNFEKKKL